MFSCQIVDHGTIALNLMTMLLAKQAQQSHWLKIYSCELYFQCIYGTPLGAVKFILWMSFIKKMNRRTLSNAVQIEGFISWKIKNILFPLELCSNPHIRLKCWITLYLQQRAVGSDTWGSSRIAASCESCSSLAVLTCHRKKCENCQGEFLDSSTVSFLFKCHKLIVMRWVWGQPLLWNSVLLFYSSAISKQGHFGILEPFSLLLLNKLHADKSDMLYSDKILACVVNWEKAPGVYNETYLAH